MPDAHMTLDAPANKQTNSSGQQKLLQSVQLTVKVDDVGVNTVQAFRWCKAINNMLEAASRLSLVQVPSVHAMIATMDAKVMALLKGQGVEGRQQ